MTQYKPNPEATTANKIDYGWAWWAGSSEEEFAVGPFPSKDDAISEALAQDCYEEVEIDGEWQRQVYFAECCGLHFYCDECGIVDNACDACRDYLTAEESAGTFAANRNDGVKVFGYDD